MKPSRLRALAAVSLSLSGACGAVVTPATRDAAVTDVPAPQDVPRVDSAADCVFPDGTRCAPGRTCSTPDGCNTCQCAAGGQLQCTLRACVDAGPPGCALPDGRVCARGQSCPLRDGCNTCACGNDGNLVCTGLACVDAGEAGDAGCVGGSIGRGGLSCAGPDDGPLPVACCRGWNCDSRQALCDRIPPTCPAGWAATVAGGCYGPCVPAANCAPLRCLGGVGCPVGWRCDDADNCVLAPR